MTGMGDEARRFTRLRPYAVVWNLRVETQPHGAHGLIAAQDETVQPRLSEVREILHAAIPDAEERISWSMPTYWKGKNIIHFAASKKHLGLYPGGEATTVFANELKNFDVSKGTIRLQWNKALPTELIQKIARWCYENYSGWQKAEIEPMNVVLVNGEKRA